MQAALDPILRRAAHERGARRVDSERLSAAFTSAVGEVQHNVRTVAGLPLAASAAQATRTEAAARALKAQVEAACAGASKQQAALEALYGAIADTGSVAAWLSSSDAALGGVRARLTDIEAALTAEGDAVQ